MAKPRKKWEPEYRFGGDRSSFYMPLELGRANGYKFPKTKKGKRK